jgi:acetyl esterase/lipase
MASGSSRRYTDGMTRKRMAQGCLLVLALGLGCLLLGVAALWCYFTPAVERSQPIAYAERRGRPLTLEILRPRRPNGLGVVLVVSGGWRSDPRAVRPFMVAPLLRRGYTVMAVSHLSQPDATVAEIAADMHRAVRFIRHQAHDYGIDPDRLGVTGGSAGGHLSLLLATRGGPGPSEAPDPVDRESSAVQAAAIFFPVTDLLNLGSSTENPGDGGPPKSFVAAFCPDAAARAAWPVSGRELSPIYHITGGLPPVLIVHGDADTLTPLEQSVWFRDRAREAGRTVELVVRHGKKHGWLGMVWDVRLFADWFDTYLRTTGAT